MPSAGQASNIGGSIGGANGLPPEKGDLYNHIMSTYRIPLPTTEEIPAGLDGRRMSFLQRWRRNGYRRAVGRFETKRHELALEATARKPEIAAKAMFSLGWLMWYHSETYGPNLWREAEDAWIKGALILGGRNPLEAYDSETYASEIIPRLLKNEIVRRNARRGSVEGDDYIVYRHLGAGGTATIYRIFGSDNAVKVFDGGLWKLNAYRLESGSWGVPIRDHIPSQVVRQVAGLGIVTQMGLAAARVYGYGDDFLVRELVPGIMLDNAEQILDAEALREAHGLYMDFMAHVDDSPHKGTVDRNPVNFVYTAGDGERKGQLTLIDF